MKRLYFLMVFFMIIDASAQVLKTSLPFSLATPYIEPDGRKLTVKVGESNFVILSKVKGHLHGESTYQLEGFDKELAVKYKTVLTCPHEEDYMELFYNGTSIFLFSVIHDEAQKKSKLMAYVFDPETGEKKEDKLINEHAIADWLESPGKGAVKSKFEDMVCFSLAKHYSTNFEYQYQINYSPDKSKLFVY